MIDKRFAEMFMNEKYAKLVENFMLVKEILHLSWSIS